MAGRPRKPDEIHILEGTFRPDRHGDPSASVAAAGQPTRPASVRGAARKVWDETIPQLIAIGTAKQIDVDALATYCRLVVIRDKLLAAVERKPATAEGRAVLSREIKDYEGMIFKLRQCFGMDCLSRTKLRQPADKKPEPVMSRKRG